MFSTQPYFDNFIAKLKYQLSLPLPGLQAHLKLAPAERIEELKTIVPDKNASQGAVMILLYPKNNCIYTSVILRNEYNGIHSGQISLPGGKKESCDKDFYATALRETQEEFGIPIHNIQLIGNLSRFYVIPSKFIIYPFVTFIEQAPVFNPDPVEVQRVIEFDIMKELQYSCVIQRNLQFKNGYKTTAPGFEVDGEYIWGATAMVFSELIQLMENIE